MASLSQLSPQRSHSVIVRLAPPEFDQLRALAFRRYPHHEWGTFARFGWRDTPDGLILTLAGLDSPTPGDLDEDVGNISIAERYTLRAALAAETHPLAVGVIHSHPRNCVPCPSLIDDDMDTYYADYFSGFAPGRPYVSLILSEMNGELAISGRVFWEKNWLLADRFVAERSPLSTWVAGARSDHQESRHERTARLRAAFGDQAAARLRRSSVAVIGAGGTGSAAIEVLARAGVGRLIIVDPDHLEESNLERVHGSRPEHAIERTPKVSLARDHVRSIDPTVEVSPYIGSLPQREIIDAIVTADVALGCTDQQHSRLALSDLTFRYLVPSIDCGVMLEGANGAVTGQIAQFVRFLAADSCALCRGMVVSQRLAQELMSEAERTQRRAAAAVAHARGDEAGAYWHDEPQLNTVGYLTTMTGALVAGYAIGWITGRFDPPFSRLQMNLVQQFFDVTNAEELPRSDCVCRRVRGWADQAAIDALITAPTHWSPVRRV